MMLSDNSPLLWPCPAKINLFLHIIGQRADGYHNIQSVFQLLDYGDQLQIELTSDNKIEFDCNQKPLANRHNLVAKAANLLLAYATQHNPQTCYGARIYLYKHLPAGAGLGGGSSDCASCLLALNHLWRLGLDDKQLSEIGLSLGADVPFFISGRNAFVEGIGEKLTAINLPECWYLLVNPAVHVATAQIFTSPLLTRNSKAITIRDLDSAGLPDNFANDMQRVVCEKYPLVKQALDWLVQFEPNARMTGSGSSLFATFTSQHQARQIADQCDWSCFIAKGVNLSPLQQKLANENNH